MNAISGIRPEYIEEAALELHARPAQNKTAKITSFRKTLLIAVPAAAAAFIFLAVAVVIPILSKLGMSTASAPADSAATAPAEAAAEAPAPVYEEPSAPEEAPVYEAEEAAAEPEAAYEAEAPSDMADANKSAAGAAEEAAFFAEMPDLESAVYENGILTVDCRGPLPENIKELEFTIYETDADGTEQSCAEGTLDTVLVSEAPLSLDLSGFELRSGTYVLDIAGKRVEFSL